MAQILSGRDVAESVTALLKEEVRKLKEADIDPALAIIRAGERSDDIAYERSAVKRCEGIGISVKKYILDKDASSDELLSVISDVNKDANIHGVLLFQPLPDHIDEAAVRKALLPEKDVDGITEGSMAGVYSGSRIGFPPCTAQACMEILDYYGIDVTGKKAVVIGRSTVVGKPAALMLIKKNATVTICHSKTEDIAPVCRDADLLIAAVGKARAVGSGCFNENQIVIDVGINVGDDGRISGDVDFIRAEPIVRAITPVPGGVGAVTTCVLAKHVIEAAKKSLRS